MDNDTALRIRAEAVFPGGMFGHIKASNLPAGYPQFMESGEGAFVVDVNGKRYLDYVCAFGPNLFGYGDRIINDAYIQQLNKGDQITGPTALMVELAETLVKMISHADWAIFSKNGTDATTSALMVARAYSGKTNLVMARGSYHGASPSWMAAGAGATKADEAQKIYCDYNDIDSLERAVVQAQDGEGLAAIFATPTNQTLFYDQAAPSQAYATRARELADRTGALLVVDEIRSGFRISRDCSWSLLGVAPDLTTWGKTLANGHAIAALLGSDKARDAAAKMPLMGTFWYQAAAMAAALATLTRVRETPYLEQITELGERLRNGLSEVAALQGIGFRQSGAVTMPLFLFDDDADFRKGFFWCSAMLREGIYTHPYHNMFMNAAMSEGDISRTVGAAGRCFKALSKVASELGPTKLSRLGPRVAA